MGCIPLGNIHLIIIGRVLSRTQICLSFLKQTFYVRSIFWVERLGFFHRLFELFEMVII